MSEAGAQSPEDAFVQRVKEARRSGAVLKARLITLRSDLPDATILVFEGDDDKIVYGQWIRRIRPGLRYEPFPCGGKKEVRALKNAVHRDMGGLGRGLFFFVDRDFDDLTGFLDVADVFVTDTYSVENYLVTDEVVEDLLRDEFPCHAKPDIRKKVLDLFRQDYDAFLKASASVNERLYIARRIPIELARRLPTSLGGIAEIKLGAISKGSTPPENLVIYTREPSAEREAELKTEFSTLEQLPPSPTRKGFPAAANGDS